VTGLDLREIVKHYRSEGEVVRAVDGVSLTVDPGEFVAICGPSGSGKSTLLQIAATILRPDGGRVSFDDRVISELSESGSARFRLRELGFVFQSFHLTGGASALDNVAMKLLADGWSLKDARRQALPWLDRVGLRHRRSHTPGQLSTGECQRVAIARALVNSPRLLLADEPTGNLDSRRGRETLGLLRDLCREWQVPTLLVTHDVEAVDFVDRLHTLRDGMLADDERPPLGLVGDGHR
jgi:putative ABC transport system ATP-binding protein